MGLPGGHKYHRLTPNIYLENDEKVTDFTVSVTLKFVATNQTSNRNISLDPSDPRLLPC